MRARAAVRCRGVLRINTSRRAAEMLLEPLFLRYLRRYPRVELEIATEEALIDVLVGRFISKDRI